MILRNERGMLLVLTMVILLALSGLAGASLINSFLERAQARSRANAEIALNAAEAGVAAGLAWLSDPSRFDQAAAEHVPDPYTGAPDWQKTLDRTLASGGSYHVVLRFKRERLDLNGNGNCCDRYPDVPADEEGEFRDGDANSCTDCPGEIVLYNEGSGDGRFGFTDAYFSGYAGDTGYPVLEVDAVGTYGAGALREVALNVARNHKPQAEGAFTSRGPVTAGGSSSVDGRNYGINGTGTSSCGSDVPGVTVDVGVAAPTCGTHLVSGAGVPCSATFDPTAPGKRALATTPWDVLGLSLGDFASMFTKDATSASIPEPCSSSPYYLWFAGGNGVKLNNSSGCSSYRGILVVHNELFDPDSWANCGAAVNPTDPAKCTAAYGPSTFEMNGNVSWTGLVIADQVLLMNGSPTIIGAVYSLASGGAASTTITGNVNVKYSCDAVSLVTGGLGYKRKIGWRRVR